MTEKLFIDTVVPSDETYRIVRDEERGEKYKSNMEGLWKIYRPYADDDYREQLAQDFHGRFWEMYLTCTLIEKSYGVVPKRTRSLGPDVLIEDSSRRIFVEAVTPSAGDDTNPDQVPEFKANTFRAERVPDDQITLRYCGSISDKYKKYESYVEKGIISPSDLYIVALNSCKIRVGTIDSRDEGDLPRIVRAVLPVGPLQATIGTSPNPTVQWQYQYRPSLSRAGGSTVPTDQFMKEEYAGMSGILYSHSDFANRPDQVGDDFIFLHNPQSARNSIPERYFRMGVEYLVRLEGDHLSISRNEWRVNR
jgi:type I restriction enzyme S subunit